MDTRGPAGTGKTETFKDIMWYCGMSCNIINCSDVEDDHFIGGVKHEPMS